MLHLPSHGHRFFLKFRGHFEAENCCSKSGNGYLEYHGRIESLTHVCMKHFKLTGRELASLIWALEIAILAFVMAVDLAHSASDS